MKNKDMWAEIKFDHSEIVPLFSVLRDGRAYTLTELSNTIKMDRNMLKSRLDDMAKKGIIKTRINRQRIYYYIDNGLSNDEATFLGLPVTPTKRSLPKGMKYCRHCYRHLAGYVGVKLTETLVKKGILVPDQESLQYTVTKKGWNWFTKWGIFPENFDPKRPLTKACLDFSERKNHLGGQLGDALLQKMLDNGWMARVPDSREIKITREGYQGLKQSLDFDF